MHRRHRWGDLGGIVSGMRNEANFRASRLGLQNEPNYRVFPVGRISYGVQYGIVLADVPFATQVDAGFHCVHGHRPPSSMTVAGELECFRWGRREVIEGKGRCEKMFA